MGQFQTDPLPETLTFTSTSFSVTGSFGTLGCSVQAVDTAAKQIQLTVTAPATGLYGFYTGGMTLYMTYSISGSTLYQSMSNGSYPSSSTNGPYTKR